MPRVKKQEAIPTTEEVEVVRKEIVDIEQHGEISTESLEAKFGEGESAKITKNTADEGSMSGLMERSPCQDDSTSKVQLATREDLWEEDPEELPFGEVVGDPLIMAEVVIGGVVTNAVMDTGATYSCVSDEMYESLKVAGRIKGELPTCKVQLTMAVGKKKVKVAKQIWVEVMFRDKSSYVVLLVVPGLFTSVLMGLNWLREAHIKIDCGSSTVEYAKDESAILPDRGITEADTEVKHEASKAPEAILSSVMAKRRLSINVGNCGIFARNVSTAVESKVDPERREGPGLRKRNVTSKHNDWTLLKEKWREKFVTNNLLV